jgi:hypothetical protein
MANLNKCIIVKYYVLRVIGPNKGELELEVPVAQIVETHIIPNEDNIDPDVLRWAVFTKQPIHKIFKTYEQFGMF